MTTRDYTDIEGQEALKKIIAEEVRKEKQAQLEQRRRQRQQEQLAQRIEQATSEFESKLTLLRERLQAVTVKQTQWRQRFENMLNEMDSLSDEQPTIQAEIRAILQDVESATYQAVQKGAMIARDTQTHFDAIGGDSGDLWPWPSDISNSRTAPDTIANSVALNIYPQTPYKPDMTTDGRKRR